MLADLPPERMYHIVPEVGHWDNPAPPASPYFVNEVPIGLLTKPLSNAYLNSEMFFDAVSLASSTVIWVIGTPEAAIEAAHLALRLSELGYKSRDVISDQPRFSGARFSLACYERVNAGGCSNVSGEGRP